METCKTCRHWVFDPERDKWDNIIKPIDPDTYEPMAIAWMVKRCRHPELMFCERPLRKDGFAVADGSTYMANLYTAEEFGCVLHETA